MYKEIYTDYLFPADDERILLVSHLKNVITPQGKLTSIPKLSSNEKSHTINKKQKTTQKTIIENYS